MKLTQLLTFFTFSTLLLSGASNAALIMDIYDTNNAVYNLDIADSTIAGTNGAVVKTSTLVDTINHWDGSGQEGHVGNSALFTNNTNDTFAVQVTGFIDITTAGLYTFATSSDDGLKLSVGGNSVIYDYYAHGVQDRFGSLYLSAGQHAIDLVFFENFGGASLELFSTLGEFTSFNNDFTLVGDINNGGLSTSTVNNVPEPSAVLLLGLGMIGFTAARRKKLTK